MLYGRIYQAFTSFWVRYLTFYQREFQFSYIYNINHNNTVEFSATITSIINCYTKLRGVSLKLF